MGHYTIEERVLEIEQKFEALSETVKEIREKLPEYDKIVDYNKSYRERLKKARGSLKKIQEIQKRNKNG